MPGNSAYWSADASQIMRLEPQTAKKLQILEDYLVDWVVTLCAKNPRMENTLTIVDGFSGGGVYLDSNNVRIPGSPLRIIEAILKGLEDVKNKYGKPEFKLDWKLICIESHPDHFSCLRRSLDEFGFSGHEASGRLELYSCDFKDKFEYCMDLVVRRKGHSFFFIDPFGYTQYSMEQIRRIMELPSSEVLLNFMIDFMARFVNSSGGKTRKVIDENLEASGYFSDAAPEDLEKGGKQLYLRNESLRLIRDKTRARYVYIFSLLKTETIVKYFLIHIANNQTAQQVMKKALWVHSNSSAVFGYQYGITGLSFLPVNVENEVQFDLFDIYNGNQDRSLPDLFVQLMDVIERMSGGLTFRELEAGTIQSNPADREIYSKCIEQMQKDGSIIKIRDRKPTKSKSVELDDIIQRNPQLYFTFPSSRKDNPFQ